MADNKNATYLSVIADLKAKKYKPVYYLMGEESYFIDKITDYVLENVLLPEERDFNQMVFFGSDVTMAKVVDAAKRYPVMAERQVIVVREAQNLKNHEILEAYLKNPQESTLLVFCHKNGKLDRNKKVASAIGKCGVLFESKKYKEWELPAFIENYLKAKGVGIDPKSKQMMVDFVGADLNRLTRELDKMLIALPVEERRITPDIIEKQVGMSKDFNAFELRDAIVNKNIFKANLIVKYFDENPKAGNIYSFIPMLFNYFQNLFLAYYCPQKNSPEALGKWLELKTQWGTKDYITGMKNYSGVKVMQIISKIREIDAKSKGLDNPNTPPGELMKELLFFILH